MPVPWRETKPYTHQDTWDALSGDDGADITAEAVFTHANGDIDIALYDPAGAAVASGTSTTDNETIVHTALATGTYAVRVIGFSGAENSYDLTLSTTGGLPGAATLISPTGTITDSTPSYVWNAVSNSTYYSLYVADATGNLIESDETNNTARRTLVALPERSRETPETSAHLIEPERFTRP